MAESSARKKRSNNEGYLGVPSKKKLKAEPEVNKFLFRVLLPNGLNLTLELENADEKMSVAEFVRTVRRQAEKEPLEKGSEKSIGDPKSTWKTPWVSESKMGRSYARILATRP
jgi:hypothetical protein